MRSDKNTTRKPLTRKALEENYEEDVTFPSTELIMKFCDLYNVNSRWLMTNYGNMYVKRDADT